MNTGGHHHPDEQKPEFSKWSTIIGILVVVCIQVAGFATLRATQPDQGGRIVLCTGIIANQQNVARDDPNVISICREVGVNREDFPPTRLANT